MGNAFAPVGRALPSRRDAVLISAASGPSPVPASMGDSIIVPEARDRLLEIFERVQTPTNVNQTLEGALSGNLWAQQLLFQAMIDTWPRLQKAIREVKLAARKAPWEVMPFAPRGEKPDAAAEKLAKEVEGIVWGMKPDPAKGLKGFEGTVEELAMGYFLGHHLLEPRWERAKDGTFRIANTKPVPPRFYGYPNWEAGEDRLMLDPTGNQSGGVNYVDFPEHRFLLAVNGGHPGHPSQAAPLRVLTGYWLAAVYGLKWVMNYAQLFGIPFRWAEYPAGDNKIKSEIAAMMANIGSAGWAGFPAGTKVNFLEGTKSGSSLVQSELLKIADEQCDIFILGQTLTSSQGDRGSQSLGTVHMEVRQDLLAGVCDFVGEILSHQLAASIVAVNHGPDRVDVPGIWPAWPEVRDEKAMAERDNTLGILDGKLPVEKAWLYERHKVPVPAAGAELFKEKPDPEPGADPKAERLKTETLKPEEEEEPEKIEAGGFRTLDDGRVIYLDKPRTKSPGDKSADSYREPKQGDAPGKSASPGPAAGKPKSRLDLIFERVEKTGEEVTINVEDANRGNLQRIVDAVKARGLDGSTDGKNVLIRPLPKQVAAADDTTSADLLKRMEQAAAAGITDPDTAAAALAAAWLKGAGEGKEDGE